MMTNSKCDKGWHSGECCCNCANHFEDFHHCVSGTNQGRCVCNDHKGWICLLQLDDEPSRAHSNWPEHGFCEMHVKKRNVFVSIFHKHAFAFAKYLSDNYEWLDNTENGDIYNDTQNNIVTEKEIFNKWLNHNQ